MMFEPFAHFYINYLKGAHFYHIYDNYVVYKYMKERKSTLLSLGLPIFIQLLLFNLLSTVDTLMVNNYNEKFIISMNNANQIIHMLNVILLISSTGVGIVIAQYLGAKKEEDAKIAFNNGLLFNLILSILLFIIIIIFKEGLLALIQCPSEYIENAVTYVSIIAWGIPLNALLNVLSANLRACKKPGVITIIAIFSNLLNVLLNYILIYGKFGFPELGITGAAIATISSQFLMCVLALIITPIVLKKKIYSLSFSIEHLKQILKIGLPSALESICYTFSGLFVTAAINKLTESEMLARAYVNMIMLYIYQFSIAFGQANAILVGHDVGENNYQKAKQRTHNSFKICLPILFGLIILLNIFGKDVFSLVIENIDNPDEVLSFATSVLPWLFLYEFGRCVNLIYINSLKAAGDVIFPLISAIICMFLCSSLGSWVLGIYLNLGFLGVFLAQALDEVVRAILMLFRWGNDKWMNKSIVKN